MSHPSHTSQGAKDSIKAALALATIGIPMLNAISVTLMARPEAEKEAP